MTVDKTAPPKPTCTPGTGNYAGSVTVTCTNTETGVTIRYTTNGTAPTTASNQYTSALTFNLTTTLTVAAWDTAGNRSVAPDNSYTYTIGNLPDTTITSQPSNPTNQTAATFAFTGTNSPTSYQCQIDGGGYSVCTSPRSYTVAQGTHTFRVKAINAFGEDPTPASYTWLVDTTFTLSVSKTGSTGSGTVTSNPDGIDCGATCIAIYNHDASVTLTAYANDGSKFVNWSGDCSGLGTSCILTMDGNKFVTAIFDLDDTESPTAQIISPAAGSWQGAQPEGFFDSTFSYSDTGGSGLSLCQYRVVSSLTETVPWSFAVDCSGAGDGPITITKQITFGPDANCRHEGINICTVHVRAQDGNGNWSEIGSSPFSIDWTPPKIEFPN